MFQAQRRILGFVAIVLMMLGIVVINPTRASANITIPTVPLTGCLRGDYFSGPNPLINTLFMAKAGDQFTFTLLHAGSIQVTLFVVNHSISKSGVGSVSISATVPADGIVYVSGASLGGFAPTTYIFDVNGACGGGPTTVFTDGRLNNMDQAETAALYCTSAGNLEVYTPSTPQWKLLFTVTPAEIAKVPKHPAQNTLIKEVQNVRLYRLTGGLLQLNAPGLGGDADYVFRFEGCAQQ
jgi:hypothetical protein